MAAAKPELLRASGRSGSTLARGEGLTVTILVLGPGGAIKVTNHNLSHIWNNLLHVKLVYQ